MQQRLIALTLILISSCPYVTFGKETGNHATPLIDDGRSTVSAELLADELTQIPPESKKRLLTDREQLLTFSKNLLIDMRIAEAARNARLNSDANYRAYMAKTTRGYLVKRYIDNEMAKVTAQAPDFTDVARTYHAANASKFTVPEAIRVAHILLKVDPEEGPEKDLKAKSAIEALHQELVGGADFGKKAAELTEDVSSKGSGGVLRGGWSDRGSLVPAFEKAAYALKPGEISAPVRTRFGYHIIKLIEHRPARHATFEEEKEKLIAKFKKDYLTEQRNNILTPFLATGDVEISDAALEFLRAQ